MSAPAFDGAINIDHREDVFVLELPARVEMHEGRPRLIPADPARWLYTLAGLVGKSLTVTLEKRRQRRSNAANAYLWGIVYQDILIGLRGEAQQAGEECPFADKDELHEACKYIVLGVDVLDVHGVKIERPASTAILNSDQFSAYVSQVKALAATRWKIYVREPGESVYV